MNLYSVSVLLFSFGVLLIAVLAFFKRRDAISMRFAFFSISVCGWGFLYSVWTSQPYSKEAILALIRASEVFAVFIPIAWLHFILDFVGEKEPCPMFYRVNYMGAVILAFLAPTPLFFTGVHEVPVFHYYKTPGPVFYFFLVLFLTLVSIAFYHLIRAYRQSSGELKQQLRFLLLGWFIAFAAGTSTFLPAVKITTFLPMLFLMPLYPFFLGISLIRYGLFDTEKLVDAFQKEKLAAIGTMAASLNHELRNPLYIAKGRTETHLDLVEQGIYALDEKGRSVLQAILKQLTRAMDIMDRFSNFAKPAALDKKENVVVNEALEEVLHLVASEFRFEKIKVVHQPAIGLSINANRRHMEEIFFNLIMNACHSMEERGGELRLSASQPNGKVIVEIEDTGTGIPKASQRRIFEPFYSTKGNKGSGLGLYITKQLVERNGGKISVKSKVGEGTRFTLALPAK